MYFFVLLFLKVILYNRQKNIFEILILLKVLFIKPSGYQLLSIISKEIIGEIIGDIKTYCSSFVYLAVF